jgi:hypothetical protein
MKIKPSESPRILLRVQICAGTGDDVKIWRKVGGCTARSLLRSSDSAAWKFGRDRYLRVARGINSDSLSR